MDFSAVKSISSPRLLLPHPHRRAHCQTPIVQRHAAVIAVRRGGGMFFEFDAADFARGRGFMDNFPGAQELYPRHGRGRQHLRGEAIAAGGRDGRAHRGIIDGEAQHDARAGESVGAAGQEGFKKAAARQALRRGSWIRSAFSGA